MSPFEGIFGGLLRENQQEFLKGLRIFSKIQTKRAARRKTVPARFVLFGMSRYFVSMVLGKSLMFHVKRLFFYGKEPPALGEIYDSHRMRIDWWEREDIEDRNDRNPKIIFKKF